MADIAERREGPLFSFQLCLGCIKIQVMKFPPIIERRLDASYMNESPENAQIARALFMVTAGLAAVSLFMAFIIQSLGPERFVLAGLFAVLGSFALLALYGKARIASLLMTTVLSVVLSSIVFLSGGSKSFFEFYMIGFLNLFAMALTVLVEYYSWQVFFTAAYSSFAVVLNLFLRAVPYGKETGEAVQYDDALIVIVLTFLAAVALNAMTRRAKLFLMQSERSGAQSDRQLGILRGAMAASSEALAQGSRLSESAAHTANLASRGNELVGQADASMKELSADSLKLGDEITLIGESSSRARQSAEGQSSVVNETSAAIEQMTASIRNINAVTRDRQGAVRELSKSTEGGREIVASSSRSMGQVESSTGAILDIVKVISSVAAQTNLLAMNAAIEAAHAGDAGRGFAVVADEIRKLSEQTSKSVKAVNDTVKETISDIRKAAEGNDRAVASFETIAREAELVSGAMQEIIGGLDELSKGTDEINRGVSDSVTSTNELREAVSSLDAQISKARESLSSLGGAAARVEGDLGLVRETIASIATETRKVEEIGRVNSEGLAALKTALDRAGL